MSDTPLCHRTIGPEFLSRVWGDADDFDSRIADPRPDPCRGSACSLWVWAVRRAEFSVDAQDAERDPGALERSLGPLLPFDGCTPTERGRPSGTVEAGDIVQDPKERGWCADNLRAVAWPDPAKGE